MNREIDEQNKYQAEIFSNRLSKRYKLLRKWARKNRVTCYRLYDRDIPEVPLAVDLYEFLPFGIEDKFEVADFLREEDAKISANDLFTIQEKSSRQWVLLQLYERPYEKPQEEEILWLEEMSKSCAETLKIEKNHVIIKVRRRQHGMEQYEKLGTKNEIKGIVQECGQLFRLDLSGYIDTGLFLDHRPLRQKIRSECAGKRVLNLFSYTGSFSVFAAEGRASFVQSVDLSKTYLAVAQSNLLLNGFSGEKYDFVRSDVADFLKNANEKNEKFDIVILDPPTFSNSKATKNFLDINRDWSKLCSLCLKLLSKNGVLYFSTNSKKLNFDADFLSKDFGANVFAQEITQSTIDEDFKNTKPHRVWKISI